MTEEEARAEVVAGVPRETVHRIERFVDEVVAATQHQNLVARSTISAIWERHVLDSKQLIPLGPGTGLWVDLGSGAGFPGLVVAIFRDAPVLLIEPRRLRADFLRFMVDRLGVASRVAVVASRAEVVKLPSMAGCISARAVAGLGDILGMGQHLADRQTRWVLPKGKSAIDEVAAARASWHGEFEIVPSITDAAAAIIVATDVRSRKSG